MLCWGIWCYRRLEVCGGDARAPTSLRGITWTYAAAFAAAVPEHHPARARSVRRQIFRVLLRRNAKNRDGMSTRVLKLGY